MTIVSRKNNISIIMNDILYRLKIICALVITLFAFSSGFLVFTEVLTGYGISAATVKGRSMMPTIKDGTFIMTYRYPSQKFKRGDIVIVTNKHGALIEFTYDKNREVIKRVVAVSGDEVYVKDGYVYVNGELESSFAYSMTNYYKGTDYKVTLKTDQYFLLGDNRINSLDSRKFGPVNAEDIEDKVIIFS